MAQYRIMDTTLTALCDAARRVGNLTGKITLAKVKEIFSKASVVDVGSDTVTADTMLSGKTAHDKAGNSITGAILDYSSTSPYLLRLDHPADLSNKYGGMPVKGFFLNGNGYYFDAFQSGIILQDLITLMGELASISVEDGIVTYTVPEPYATVLTKLILLPNSNTFSLPQQTDLVPGNILSGKNIFGVDGTLAVKKIRTVTSAPTPSTDTEGFLFLVVEEA